MDTVFKHEIGHEVIINNLKTTGTIIGLYFDGKIQYNVTFFHNGERKTLFLMENEISKKNRQKLGFQTGVHNHHD